MVIALVQMGQILGKRKSIVYKRGHEQRGNIMFGGDFIYKIHPKINPKLDSKTGRIATEKRGPNITPVMVSAIDNAHRKPNPIRLEIYLNRY